MEFGFLSQLITKLEGRVSPLWGQFELLPNCNLSCSMCYIHTPVESREKLQSLQPASFWIDVAHQAVDAGMLILSITGGETLLYPELELLLEAVSKMGLFISFNTNGTLIDAKQVSRLSRYSLAKINITLYGASDETYHKVTGCQDGFKRVSRAIDLLQDAGQNVYLNCVMVPDNKDDLPSMIEFAKSKDLVLHETVYMFPRREWYSGYEPNKYRLTPEGAAKVSRDCAVLTKGERQYRKQAAMASFRDHQISKLPRCSSRMRACRAGCYEFAVNWHGEMQPCVMLPSIHEDLKAQSFIEAWQKCVSNMRNLPFPKKCVICSHLDTCPVCPAAIYLETGTHDTAPEYLCKYSEAMLEIWDEDSKEIKVKTNERSRIDGANRVPRM